MLYRNGRMVFSGAGIGGIGDASAPLTAEEYVVLYRGLGMQVPPELIAAAEGEQQYAAGGALGRRTTPSSATPAAKDQQSICSATAQAIARGNKAAAGLLGQCNALRAQNIAAGQLALDGYAIDPDMRVQLMNSGKRIVESEPALASAMASLSPDGARGFMIGVRVARGAGGINRTYATAVRATLVPEAAAQGFDLGIAKAAAGGTQKAGNGAADEGGIPRAVIIGGAAIGVLALAAGIYKFTR